MFKLTSLNKIKACQTTNHHKEQMVISTQIKDKVTQFSNIERAHSNLFARISLECHKMGRLTMHRLKNR